MSSPVKENRNVYSNMGEGCDNNTNNQNNERMSISNMQMDAKTPIKQPIKITVSSPTKQNRALVERCQKLEQYCRELVKTNKILDCENRLAIA